MLTPTSCFRVASVAVVIFSSCPIQAKRNRQTNTAARTRSSSAGLRHLQTSPDYQTAEHNVANNPAQSPVLAPAVIGRILEGTQEVDPSKPPQDPTSATERKEHQVAMTPEEPSTQAGPGPEGTPLEDEVVIPSPDGGVIPQAKGPASPNDVPPPKDGLPPHHPPPKDGPPPHHPPPKNSSAPVKHHKKSKDKEPKKPKKDKENRIDEDHPDHVPIHGDDSVFVTADGNSTNSSGVTSLTVVTPGHSSFVGVSLFTILSGLVLHLIV